MNRPLSVCIVLIVLAACQPTDEAFLSLDPLPPPATASIGIPVRVVAVGGSGVKLELTQGKFGDDQTASKCLTVNSEASDMGAAEVGSEVVIVVPDDVEALMIGHLYERCSDMEGAGGPALAVAQRALRIVAPNMPDVPSAWRTEGGGS
jgi:hypothetical protein